MGYVSCIGRALAVALGIGVALAALRTTANHHLITRGLADPKSDRAGFSDLKELTAWAKQARDSGPEMWASDSTLTQFGGIVNTCGSTVLGLGRFMGVVGGRVVRR